MRSVARRPALVYLDGFVELEGADRAVVGRPWRWALRQALLVALTCGGGALVIGAMACAGLTTSDGAADVAGAVVLGLVTSTLLVVTAWSLTRAATCRAVAARERVTLDRERGVVVSGHGVVALGELRRVEQVHDRFSTRIVATRDQGQPIVLVPALDRNRHARDLFTLSRWIADFLDLPAA